jgi:hypothetical protein
MGLTISSFPIVILFSFLLSLFAAAAAEYRDGWE